jgi:succinate dehydrogenase/fumarate reductase flavoprotein subunit
MEQRNSNSADIVIAGAGGYDLVAALAAAEKGAGVLVLEKTEKLGGGTSFSSRSLRAAGTRFQRAAGIEDSPERYAEEILQRNHRQSRSKYQGLGQVPGSDITIMSIFCMSDQMVPI